MLLYARKSDFIHFLDQIIQCPFHSDTAYPIFMINVTLNFIILGISRLGLVRIYL